jgi:CHAT domain-containing protein/tetratricopeptide (TPR) repeat protein
LKLWFYLLFISTFVSATDFQTDLTKYKAADNLQMYIYTYLDKIEAAKTAKDTLFNTCLNSLWREAKIKKEHLALVYYWANYAYYLKQNGQLQKATIAYEKTWEIYNQNQLKRFEIYESCLKPLANIYTRLGDYEKAIFTHKLILEAAQENNNDALATGTLINIAVIYHDLGRVQDAIDLLMQAKNTNKLSDFHHFLIYSKLAKNHLLLNNTSKAKTFASQIGTNTPYKKAVYFKINASISSKNNRYDQTQYYLRAALRELKKSKATKRKIAKTELDLARAYEHYNNNIVYAHRFANKALKTLFNEAEIKEKQLKSKLFAENTFKAIFDFKAQLYAKEKQFQKALVQLDLAFYVDELLSATFSYQDSKLFLQNEIRRRSEFAIENCLKLQDTVKAFEYASQSKSLILAEEHRFNQSKKSIKNEHLFHVANALKQKIAHLKSIENIAGEKLKQLNQYSNELKQVKSKIEENNSKLKPITLNQIQPKLKNSNSTLISFFEGENKSYIFKITATNISLTQFENNSELIAFIKLFKNYNTLENQFEDYKKLGFSLYSKMGFRQIKTKHIILVPDGIYSTFPFDALLTKSSSASTFAKLPYLLNQFEIHFAYSSNLYFNVDKQNNKIKQVLGIFPIFKDSKLYLKYSENELINLEAKYKGLFLTESNATKANFNTNCNKFDIIHISTHAASSPKPFVQFKDSILKLEEIYGLSLTANLVVLSACKTGTGRIQKGEGALSLARAFKYAGATSIMQSLWQVNDQATALLMNNFYTNLNKKGIKSEALHQAKLDYLNNSSIKNLKKSPYYWAAFQYYGNAEKVSIETQSKFNYYWVFLLAVLVPIFIIYRKYK